MVEGVVVNFYQQINKQRQKQLYVIADYKKTDGNFKRARLRINYVVAGTFLVPFPVNFPATAPILTATTTTILPENTSTSVPANHYTPVDPVPVPKTTTTTVAPALIPTITTVPANRTNIVAPAPEPTINTTVASNPPNPVVPEPDTTTTTCIYANPHTQNDPVPDPNPPPNPVAPLPDTPSPTTSNPAVVADCHVVKWCNSDYVIDLYGVPSLQWNFTNQFDYPVYPNFGVWMSRLDAWLMMYG